MSVFRVIVYNKNCIVCGVHEFEEKPKATKWAAEMREKWGKDGYTYCVPHSCVQVESCYSCGTIQPGLVRVMSNGDCTSMRVCWKCWPSLVKIGWSVILVTGNTEHLIRPGFVEEALRR